MNLVYILISFAFAILVLAIFEYRNLKKPENNNDEIIKKHEVDKSWHIHERQLRNSVTVSEELTDVEDINFSNHIKIKNENRNF